MTPLENTRILLVDNNKNDTKEFEYMFESIKGDSSSLDIAYTEQDVKTLLGNQDYTTIFVELEFSTKESFRELLALFFSYSPKTPIIILTSKEDDDIVSICSKGNVFYYLHKFEFSASTLRRVILMSKESNCHRNKSRIDTILPKFEELRTQINSEWESNEQRVTTQ